MRWLASVVCAFVATGVGACGLAGCGSGAAAERGGWSDLVRDARMHESRANEQELAAQHVARESYGPYRWACGDQQLLDQETTGGRQLTTFRPCVNLQDQAVDGHRRAARRERAAARRDRQAAAALVRRETEACGGLAPAARATSIFARRELVASITPLGADGAPLAPGAAPHGVRVVLAAPGLTAAQVRADLTCRRAQWAVLGNSSDLLRHDPTLVHDAHVDVRDVARGVEVDVITSDTSAARQAIARAEGRAAPARPLEAAR